MRKFKTGGVSQCFHCQRQLQRIKGGFIYALILDPDGHEIRVHKSCQQDAVGEGYILPKENHES
jgi:hypothetical protein